LNERQASGAVTTDVSYRSMSSASADLSLVTVVITNYNGREVLPRTVETLRAVLGPSVPVVVADDGSDDGSREQVERQFPDVGIVSPGHHTAQLNVVRNVGLRAATTPLVFLIDNDILVTPGCLEELMRVLGSSESILCCTPRLLDAEDPDRIYADGNYLHFLGLSGAPKRNRLVSETPVRPPHATFGGGIMLIDMRHAETLGLFDEGFAIGWADDAEFQMRGRMRGLEALHVPGAACLHASKDHGTRRSYGQFYNRYRLVCITYSPRALLLLAPPLLVFEAALTLLTLVMGIGGERWRAVRQAWRDRADIRARRAVVQATRRVRDSALLNGGSVELAGPVGRSGPLRAVTRATTLVLDVYWHLVRRLICAA
jgi:GT2 family glycosyltransferase